MLELDQQEQQLLISLYGINNMPLEIILIAKI